MFLDAEHGAITPDVCEGLVRAAELVGLPSVVRVPANDPHVILSFLHTLGFAGFFAGAARELLARAREG